MEIKAEVGSVINADDVIIVLETDKVSIDVPTPISGTVSAINVGMDDEVAVGAELLQIVPGEGQAVPPPSAPPATPAPAAESAPSSPAPSSSASSSPSPSSSHGRVPAIRFRHGVREEAPAAPASVLSTGDYQDGDELAAGMVSLPPAGQPFTPIPERYRVKPLDAYTIELIEMGGAEPY